jgi:multiple sugar transport system permease protein
MHHHTARHHTARPFYAFASPWLAGFVIFSFIPVLVSVYMSLTASNGARLAPFVGLSNYTHLFGDPIFGKAILVTLYYAGASVTLQVVVAFILASLLNVRARGSAVFRSLLFIPYVITGIPVYVIWAWLYQPQYGLFNKILTTMGLPGPQWLLSTTWVLPALVFMSVTTCGGMVLVFLAGLQSVPTELLDASRIDGAGVLRRVWSVVVPILRPVVGFNIIWGILGASQTFAQPYAMTNGGPNYASELLGLDVYQQAYSYYHFGYAAAMATLVVVVAVALAFMVLRLSRTVAE